MKNSLFTDITANLKLKKQIQKLILLYHGFGAKLITKEIAVWR
jgi:hypothetical protein